MTQKRSHGHFAVTLRSRCRHFAAINDPESGLAVTSRSRRSYFVLQRSYFAVTTRLLRGHYGHYAVTTRSLRSLRGHYGHYAVTTVTTVLRGHNAVTTVTTRSLRGHNAVTTVTTRSLRGHYAVTTVTMVTTRSLWSLWSLRGHYGHNAVTTVTTRSLRSLRGHCGHHAVLKSYILTHSRLRKRSTSLQNGLFDQDIVAVGL